MLHFVNCIIGVVDLLIGEAQPKMGNVPNSLLPLWSAGNTAYVFKESTFFFRFPFQMQETFDLTRGQPPVLKVMTRLRVPIPDQHRVEKFVVDVQPPPGSTWTEAEGLRQMEKYLNLPADMAWLSAHLQEPDLSAVFNNNPNQKRLNFIRGGPEARLKVRRVNYNLFLLREDRPDIRPPAPYVSPDPAPIPLPPPPAFNVEQRMTGAAGHTFHRITIDMCLPRQHPLAPSLFHFNRFTQGSWVGTDSIIGWFTEQGAIPRMERHLNETVDLAWLRKVFIPLGGNPQAENDIVATFNQNPDAKRLDFLCGGSDAVYKFYYNLGDMFLEPVEEDREQTGEVQLFF